MSQYSWIAEVARLVPNAKFEPGKLNREFKDTVIVSLGGTSVEYVADAASKLAIDNPQDVANALLGKHSRAPITHVGPMAFHEGSALEIGWTDEMIEQAKAEMGELSRKYSSMVGVACDHCGLWTKRREACGRTVAGGIRPCARQLGHGGSCSTNPL